jgi:hypothetical protein
VLGDERRPPVHVHLKVGLDDAPLLLPRSLFRCVAAESTLGKHRLHATGGGDNKRTCGAGGGHRRFLGHLDFPQPLALLGQGFSHVFLVLLLPLVVRHVDVLCRFNIFII